MTTGTLLFIISVILIVTGILGLITDSYRLLQVSSFCFTLLILVFITAVLQVYLG